MAATDQTDASLIERLKKVGLEKLTPEQIKRLFELYLERKIEADLIQAAMSTSTEAAKAAFEAFKLMHSEYTASATQKHKQFADMAQGVIDALRVVALSPDLSPGDRVRLAEMIRSALDCISEAQKHQTKEDGRTTRTIATVIGAVVLGIIAIVTGGRVRANRA